MTAPIDVDALVFRSRALAQAHPFTTDGYRFMRRVVDRERLAQPRPELGEWAGHALTTGYCLRRVEEVDVTGDRADDPPVPDLAAAEEQAEVVVRALRTDGLDEQALFPEPVLVETLDRLILGEIDRRLDQWRGAVDPERWRELENYLAWWVLKGYAFRVVETS
jgi:hypothetical protein